MPNPKRKRLLLPPVRVEPNLYDAIAGIANHEDRSVSDVMRELLRAGLKQQRLFLPAGAPRP